VVIASKEFTHAPIGFIAKAMSINEFLPTRSNGALALPRCQSASAPSNSFVGAPGSAPAAGRRPRARVSAATPADEMAGSPRWS